MHRIYICIGKSRLEYYANIEKRDALWPSAKAAGWRIENIQRTESFRKVALTIFSASE